MDGTAQFTSVGRGCKGLCEYTAETQRAHKSALNQGPTVRMETMNSALPGAELIELGLNDLRNGCETVESLLVSIGSPRLRRIGVDVPETTFPHPEHRLYDLLEQVDSDSAHSRYNALIRRLVSFERAAECVKE